MLCCAVLCSTASCSTQSSRNFNTPCGRHEPPPVKQQQLPLVLQQVCCNKQPSTRGWAYTKDTQHQTQGHTARAVCCATIMRKSCKCARIAPFATRACMRS
jgi:hypothetical protein